MLIVQFQYNSVHCSYLRADVNSLSNPIQSQQNYKVISTNQTKKKRKETQNFTVDLNNSVR